ncbi:MAG: glycosyltransferase [Lachnospiraceae bacterium]|nr:glycosyltransferase [Lachnospiraceae bacterium]
MCSIKVSVIIPVYNAEKHLRQCLDSVAAQTLQEIEILCVDDGSTDASPSILEEYAASDNRFRIFHQQNLYAGVARNNGMSHASGKYLAFWDSDDYFYPEALEKMYRKAEEDQADICLCDANQYYDGIGFETTGGMYLSKKHKPASIPFSGKTESDIIFNIINTAPWNKLFLRDFVRKSGLQFQPVRNGNDMFFVECAIAIADTITIVKEPLMVYRKNQESSLVGSTGKAPEDAINVLIDIHDELIRRDIFPKKSFLNRAMVNIIYMLRNGSSSSESFFRSVQYLKETGIERLSLNEVSQEDFYNPWHYECLQHLKTDSPADFMAYLFHYTYIKLTEANAKRIHQKQKAAKAGSDLKTAGKALKEAEIQLQEMNRLKEENQRLRQDLEKVQKKLEDTLQSNSYRLGHALMWLPGKLKNG